MAATQDLRTEFLTYVRGCRFSEMFARCSELESAIQPGVVLDSYFYVHYFFSCLFTGALVQAKFLWKRLPSDLRSDHEIAAVWSVCKNLIKRKYSEVFRLLDAGRWRAADEMNRLFRAQFTERMTNLLAKAYSSIKVHQAASMLGMTPTDATNFATSRGWTVKGDVIHPKAAGEQSDRQVRVEEIERVTQMLNFLEQREHAF